MKKGRRFKAVPCTLEHAMASQVIAISHHTGRPVAPILRKFFDEQWGAFLDRHPEWKALAELGPIPELEKKEEGEIAATA